MSNKISQQILSKLPAKQSELAKALNIDKRIVSKVVIAMEKNGLINRKKISNKGITTYMIQKNVTRNVTDTFKLSQLNPKYTALLNEHKQFSPCTSCSDECKPTDCEKLSNWVM